MPDEIYQPLQAILEEPSEVFSSAQLNPDHPGSYAHASVFITHVSRLDPARDQLWRLEMGHGGEVYTHPEYGTVTITPLSESKNHPRLLIVGKQLLPPSTFSHELTLASRRINSHVTLALRLAFKYLPHQFKLTFMEWLVDQQTYFMNCYASEVQAQLVKKLCNLASPAASLQNNISEHTTLPSLAILFDQDSDPQYAWSIPTAEPLKFNIRPYITQPLELSEASVRAEPDISAGYDIFAQPFLSKEDKENQEKDLQTVRKRLSELPAIKMPNVDLTDGKYEAWLRPNMEFVSVDDIEGGVFTTQNWADVLNNWARPKFHLPFLITALMTGTSIHTNDDFFLVRVKEYPSDPGKLFVREGNHRVTAMKALGVQKFPILVYPVVKKRV